jgi:rare lipoprotein A (peptidoglycan hydrolase)
MRTASLSQPSGLAALEAEASGRRTVTTAFRSARTSTARVRPAHPATTKKVVRRGSWRKARVSWYGPGFYGRTMAGGGKLTPKSMVVAHRSLPFGTKIEFSYRGRTCIAVVRDRGPFVRGRTFDLGPGTAKALRFSGVGTVRWRIVK